MPCDNQVGVKNIMLTFRDCDTDEVYGPISHELSSDTQPQYRTCGYENEPLPGGYVRRSVSNEQIELTIVRNLGIPLSLYQGCASIDIQIEHFNGLVYSAVDGTGTGAETSDGHEVTMTLIYREIDELLPAGTLDTTVSLAA
ncbi:virion-associated protein [Synechococcus phage Ssp-JY38]|nr:hypothetical protein [Synechococcus phage Yong-L2-223]